MMWPLVYCLSIRAAAADALFASRLQQYEEPDAARVRQAAAAAVWAFGCSGCAERVAQEFGDHPETAVIRMRWARAMAREAFAGAAPGPRPRASAGSWLAGPAAAARRADTGPAGGLAADVERGG
jgi:hypothetical protein